MFSQWKWRIREYWYMRPRSKEDVRRWATATFICKRKGHQKATKARLSNSGTITTKTYCVRCHRLLDWHIEDVPHAEYLNLQESRELFDTGTGYHDYR